MYYLISILFGLIPEVLYFTLFITYTKNIKEKRIKLFLLISIAYFLCMICQRLIIIYYILLIICIYLSAKILYKNKIQIIDLFAISFSSFWITFISAILLLFLGENNSNYYCLYFLDRCLLFVPFIFINKIRILYNKYCKLWNRNDNEKRPIKSITLRNISLILLNGFIFILNIAIINIINFYK